MKPPHAPKKTSVTADRVKFLTEEQRIFVRKAFMLPGVQNKFNDWFDYNLIYCHNTHGFVHRCFDEFKYCENYRDAQFSAGNIIDVMSLEFLCMSYDINTLKKAVETVEYTHPLEKLKQEAEKYKEGEK